MNEEYTKQFEQFERDIARHTVSVLREDGLYRHLRCSAGSFFLQFDVITWPGYLSYTGDMGCFVFTRVPDMFGFFRGRRTALIDRGYLAEKAVATDKTDGLRTYSEELFQRAVAADVKSFIEENELDAEQAASLRECVAADVLSYGDNRHDAIDAAMQFRWAADHAGEPKGRDVFPDFWEHRLEDYTPRFWWCCYAIPWAIEQYDALKSVAALPAGGAAPTE